MPVSLINSSNNIHPGYRSGIYYLSDPNAISPTAVQNVVANNSLTYIPIYIPHPVLIDRIGFYVGTGFAGCFIRLGLYSNNNGLPKNLIFDSGDILCASTGFKEAVISASLAPNNYWIAANNTGGNNPSINAVLQHLGYKYYIGEAVPSIAAGTLNLRENSVTYGAMPSIAPVSNLISSGQRPIFWFRAV